MKDELFSYLNKPVLWQRSSALFWDDGYISGEMLKAHIDPDCDAASRKLATIEKSVEWLSKVIAPGSRVLDIGCGPGLYTKRLSVLGYDVTGMDYSRRSIDYARDQDEKTKYIYKNYLEMDYELEFDAITLIYCDYAALTQKEREILLSCIYRALKPGGIFIFDVFNMPVDSSQKGIKTWYKSEKCGFWAGEPYLCLDATYSYENGTVTADRHTVVTSSDIKDYIIWNTFYTKDSLTREINASGLIVKDVFADVCGKPYNDNSETICVIAEKRSG